ncbi:hypothetical protein SCHPADRAFT_690375 [Schizopora paradoxa]|uniref:Uncharacterized protein n=1 Tax=Schizopora paradoxa TaxID=27342 RepID=A0A0H2R527_9AGAM|nr:hypothetical protein SCHPADRAFT_690375 [Schizopora paradoxa]
MYPMQEDENLFCLGLGKKGTFNTVDTNATAPNLPGPGRTVGLLLDMLGKRLESFLNKRATKRGLGPKAVAEDIRMFRKHRVMSLSKRYTASLEQLPKKDAKGLKRRCKILLGYVRSSLLSTQLIALEELVSLCIEDPTIRTTLATCSLESFELKYREPALFIATTRAFKAVSGSAVHAIWTSVVLRAVPIGGENHEALELWSCLRESLTIVFHRRALPR